LRKVWKRTAGHSLMGALGGLSYGALEVFCRGYTHISMVLTGGICFLTLWQLSKSRRNIVWLSILGGAVISVAELVAGCIVNLWMHLNIWDYSQEELHFCGQICPRFFLLWCLLSFGVIGVCRYGRRFWSNYCYTHSH